MPGGWKFNTRETLNMINRYYMGRFKSGRYDQKGFRKFFYNITKPAVDLAQKFLDLDTKDIILQPESNSKLNELRVFFMRKRLNQWFKDKDAPKLINEMRHRFVKHGHLVIKKIGRGEWKAVNIENLRYDPTVENLKDSNVSEVHRMTRSEIKEKNWSNTQAIQELFDRGEKHTYLIYEYYFKDKDGSWNRTIYADLWATKNKKGDIQRSEETLIDDKDEFLPALILDEKENVKFPYRDVKFEHVPGRYLGFGFVEYLEDNQVAINEAENLERKGLMFKALQLWQTRDDTIGSSNVLTDAENGDILTVDSELNLVPKDNTDIAAFNNTRNRWDSNTQEKTFSFDIAKGANLPSRTRVGVANLSAQAVESFFDLKREKFGNFLKKWIIEDVIPDFERDTINEHKLVFNGSDDELAKLDQMIVELKVEMAKAEHMEETGFAPSEPQIQDARERIRQELNRQRNRYLKIPEGFYKNAKYHVDVLTTGEQVDVGQRQQVVNFALQTVASNPTILENDRTRTAFFKLLNLGGVSPAELNLMEEQQRSMQGTRQPQAERGGSVGQGGQQQSPAALLQQVAQQQ